MKVFEILRDDVALVGEEQLEKRLASFDWKYEFSDDTFRLAKGQQELELIENLVYRFWKKEPSKAISLWNKYAGVQEQDSVPSFIYRLQAQE